MIGSIPYTGDWRIIRERLMYPDYKQVSSKEYGGCWSERPDRIMIKMNKKRAYDEAQNGL